MQYSTAASDALLALACVASVIIVGRARARYHEADQPALFCALLGFALTAGAAICGSVRYGLDPDWQGTHLWLSQASTFLGLPLIGCAALALSRSWAWSRSNWGRILLGLCAFFELARQLNQLAEYRLLLNLSTLALVLYAGIIQRHNKALICAAAAAAGLFAVAGLAVGTNGYLGGIRRVDLFHLLLTPAYPLLAWLLLKLPGHSAVSTQTGEPTRQ
ncbi:hypothetical protein [Pseudomonas segetis]|uniref:Uncharacterized protein n=1 Tax=Pseudomonas segetis TaxID=298908 RepID=A0A239H1Z1_9PSED|nr:hypothetical protein [Pseudomonas segetis]SNS75068.1 hypothetical protein SAMN05216255_3244 [Pseudomonas segetis]